ncbi:MAG: Xaa-Pro peptidase family protein [bacterium]|nr:Xaa-Pro peptidase family protein [bacterium]
MLSRTDRLRELLDDNEAVIISSYPNIFYYSGFTSEDAYLLISHDKKLLVTDSRYTIQAREQAPDYEIVDSKEGFKNIFKRISSRYIGFEENYISVKQHRNWQYSMTNDRTLIPMQKRIEGLRQIKDKYEIRHIAEAERIGDEAFSYILDKIRPGITEREIALELEFFMKKQSASALSFETIAASGVRGAMPHGIASGKIIEKGDLLTLDFGCVYEGYCSDMTRTVAVGSVNDKQREIYDIVLKAQQTALDMIFPGKMCSEIDTAARNVIKAAGYGENFGHALGHSVGIEIHETPVFSSKSKDIIKPGHVITVEPGIYIDGFGGVRIEDLVAVTENGIQNLTHSPKELIII